MDYDHILEEFYIYIYIYVPTYVFAVVKWADGFLGVPRVSPVLGRTVSGSTFRWHLSHLFLDLFLLLVDVGINSAALLALFIPAWEPRRQW